MDLFNDFKEYIKENGYQIDEINENSVRGIKGELIIHLFKERLFDDQYVFNVNNNEYAVYNIAIIKDGEEYRLDCKNDNREFNSVLDIINYTKDNIEIEI